MKICRIVPSLVIVVFLFHGSIAAQSTSFTYQGELQLSSQPANGTFDFEFLLYDAASGGTQIGATATRSNITVTDGRFTVSLDFGANFTGPERFLEIRVRQTGGGGFTILDPRQRIGSSPYAVRSVSAAAADTATTATNATNAVNATNAANATNATNATTAATATNALSLGGVAANQYVLTNDPRMSDPRPPTAGSGNYIQNSTTQQALSNFNISGDGRARNLDATAAILFNGTRAIWSPGTDNIFAGVGSGLNGTTGTNNSFFGRLAGGAITTGENNSFFGSRAGLSNNSGSNHSFFGHFAGRDSAVGSEGNTFIGQSAGLQTTNGSGNTFIGRGSGTANTIGSGNTLIGGGTFLGANNLTYATAIGADSTVSESSTIVLGRSAGQDKVVIPGQLMATLPITSATINATTQFNLGGSRILGNAGTGNLFAGINAGAANTGTENAFFGFRAGEAQTGAFRNTFIGSESGRNTTFGTQNTFVGAFAGLANTEGVNNTYMGNQAGQINQLGSGNAFFGAFAGNTLQTGSLNTFIGEGAGNGFQNGSGNTFIGQTAGAASNNTGNNNTLLGKSTNFAGNISFATAIGAEASVTTSNTIVLGRTGGQDRVTIPGTSRANVVETVTHFAIGSNRVLANPGSFNLYAGVGTGSTLGSMTGTRNSFFGTQAGNNIENGNGNSFFGAFSGFQVDSGSANTFIGDDAGRQTVSGTRNTFVGRAAGTANVTGEDNVILGASAGGGNIAGIYNTYVGSSAASSASSGDRNTFIGGAAGGATSAGSRNTLLGFDSSVGNSLSYATAIGAESTVTTNNTIALGRSNGTDTVKVYGRLRLGTFGTASATTLCYTVGTLEVTTCSSSLRYKENVFDYTHGLSLIRRLRPVYFDWKHNGVRDFGLVAEEVAAVEPLLATTNKDGEIQGVNYERVGVVLVNAVNEQQTVIEMQQRQINDLLEANRRQQAQIEALTKLFCSANPAAGICRDKP